LTGIPFIVLCRFRRVIDSAKRHKGRCTNIIIANNKKASHYFLIAKYSSTKDENNLQKFRLRAWNLFNKNSFKLSKIFQK